MVKRMRLVEHALEVELDSLGIEGRPVVETHIPAEVEGIYPAVAAGLFASDLYRW